MANDAINVVSHQRVTGLNGDEAAEAAAKHKDRINPQRSAEPVKNDAEPAHGVAVNGEDTQPIRVGRDITQQQANDPADGDDPAVATIFAFARSDMSLRKERSHGQREPYNRQRDAGGLGKKHPKAPGPPYREPKIARSSRECDEDHDELPDHDDVARANCGSLKPTAPLSTAFNPALISKAMRTAQRDMAVSLKVAKNASRADAIAARRQRLDAVPGPFDTLPLPSDLSKDVHQFGEASRGYGRGSGKHPQ